MGSQQFVAHAREAFDDDDMPSQSHLNGYCVKNTNDASASRGEAVLVAKRSNPHLENDRNNFDSIIILFFTIIYEDSSFFANNVDIVMLFAILSDTEAAMSDGPYKSLPHKPHWKKVAKQAERDAFAPDQVCTQMQNALLRELRDSPTDTVRHILKADPQQDFFSDHTEASTAALEQLRAQFPGSATSTFLIDAAIAVTHDGLTGDDAYRKAVEAASDAIARSHARSIEEHYLRHASSKQTQYVRVRLDEALDLCDHTAVANSFLAPQRSLGKAQPTKSRGVDEGPPLP